MPQNKEAFSKQANECRLRVKFVLELKNDVGNCVEDACTRLMEELQKLEDTAQTADPKQIKRMTQALRNSRKLLKDFEDALERVRLVYEDEDIGFDVDDSTSHMAPSVAAMMRQSDQSAPFDRMQLMNLHQTPTERPVQNGLNVSTSNQHAAGDNVLATTSTSELLNVPASPNQVDDLLCMAPAIGTGGSDHHRDILMASPVESQEVFTDGGQNNGSYELLNIADSSRPVETHATSLPEPSLIMESAFESETSTQIAIEQVSAEQPIVENRQETTEISNPVTVEPSMAYTGGDYRKHVVSQGTGDPNEVCQRSIELIRSEPILCTLSHVQSPSLFWVNLFTNIVGNIENDLNCDLDEEKKALSNPKVGDYCAAPVETDEDLMRRAKILEIKDNTLGTSFAKILYIDTGKVDWVAVKALVELPRPYRHYPRQACPCVLSELVPAGDYWTDDVVNAFREICSDEGYELYVTGLDEEESPDINTVTLYRVKKDDESKKETVLISLIKSAVGKVRRGERVIPMVAFENEGGELIGGRDPPDETEGWRFTVRVLANDDSEEREETQEEIESREAQRESLRQSLAERAVSTVTQGEIHQIPLNHESIMDKDGYIFFRMLEAISPGNFYIQMADHNGRNTRLESLMRNMNTFYSNPVNQVLLSRSAVNQAAAAFSTKDGVTCFRRVIIKNWRIPPNVEVANRDIRVHSIVTAIFVDYGYCENLQGKDVFVLDKRFCEIPAQAAYCQLFACSPPFGNGQWERNSSDVFKQLTMEGKPLMKAFLLSDQQPYGLVIYRQESSGEWVCINTKMVDSNLASSEMQFS